MPKATDEVQEKPPYRVPSMAEVAAVPWNGMTVASTFSGCGGSCLGYRMAGFRVGWANEFVPSAQDSYRANMAEGSFLDPRDVKMVKPGDVLRRLGVERGELDLFDGSPPCQAFSTAGKRHKGWGEEKSYEGGGSQRNEDMFFQWLRLLRGLLPMAFVAENVSGLVKGVAKGYFLEILAEMKAAGYRVRAKVLDAQWLGVPQQRQRVIFVGLREDLGLDPAFPSPLPWRYSVRDAIPWISEVSQGIVYGEDRPRVILSGDVPPTLKASGMGAQRMNEIEVKIVRIRRAKGFGGEEWVAPSDPYTTVGTSPAAGCNLNNNGGKVEVELPEGAVERRRFTITELRRICAFPDDFVLTGSYAQQWERLGNSVPPLMMRAIAEVVRDQLLSAREKKKPHRG